MASHTRLRKGFDGLVVLVQTAPSENPFSGNVIVFRGRRDDIIKVLCFNGQGLLLLSQRLERGRFVWPQATSGGVSLRAVYCSHSLRASTGACRCARAGQCSPPNTPLLTIFDGLRRGIGAHSGPRRRRPS